MRFLSLQESALVISRGDVESQMAWAKRWHGRHASLHQTEAFLCLQVYSGVTAQRAMSPVSRIDRPAARTLTPQFQRTLHHQNLLILESCTSVCSLICSVCVLHAGGVTCQRCKTGAASWPSRLMAIVFVCCCDFPCCLVCALQFHGQNMDGVLTSPIDFGDVILNSRLVYAPRNFGELSALVSEPCLWYFKCSTRLDSDMVMITMKRQHKLC